MGIFDLLSGKEDLRKGGSDCQFNGYLEDYFDSLEEGPVKEVLGALFAKDNSLKIIVKALDDKRASDIDVLNISKLTSLGDYFIICSCGSGVQVRACADEVEEKMKEVGISPLHVEGYRGGNWILMDFDDIIVHIMDRETRGFYALEHLWNDAEKIEIDIEEK